MQKGNIIFQRDLHKKDYTCVSNHALRNKNLSFKAKGLFVYLLSLPDDWELYKSELKDHSKDKRVSIDSALNELIENGYLKISKTQCGKSTAITFCLVENPHTTDENQHRVCTKSTSDCVENQQLLNTKTNINILTTNNSVVSFSNLNEEVKEFIKNEYGLKFTDDFYINLINLCDEKQIDVKEYFGWLINTKRRVAKSLDSYLYKSACNQNVINEFLRSKKQFDKNRENQNKKIICPSCNHKFQNIDFITRKCVRGSSLNDIMSLEGGCNE
jgi:hypothetical protein